MYAVINVGSNSVRLLVSDGNIGKYKKVITTRLSEGLESGGELSRPAIERTVAAVYELVSDAAKENSRPSIFATEAVRNAVNASEFIDAVYRATGIVTHVVSGGTEAALAFAGAYGGAGMGAVVDIGGASCEITVGDRNGTIFAESVPIGVVRMRDRCGEDIERLNAYIDGQLARFGVIPQFDGELRFVGGTASTVVKILDGNNGYGADMDGRPVSDTDLAYVLDRLLNEDRDGIAGLPESRKDLMVGGVLLMRATLRRLDRDRFTYSYGDNLEGYLRLFVLKNKYCD